MNQTVDPITLETILNVLQSISDEISATMSAIVDELLDMGTASTDRGDLATSGAGIPSLVGVLDKAVQRIIELKDYAGGMAPADVFVTNDPCSNGVTYLNDAVFAKLVFVSGQCLAWAANIAHWNDIGGLVPSSMSTDARGSSRRACDCPPRNCLRAASRSDRASSSSHVRIASVGPSGPTVTPR